MSDNLTNEKHTNTNYEGFTDEIVTIITLQRKKPVVATIQPAFAFQTCTRNSSGENYLHFFFPTVSQDLAEYGGMECKNSILTFRYFRRYFDPTFLMVLPKFLKIRSIRFMRKELDYWCPKLTLNFQLKLHCVLKTSFYYEFINTERNIHVKFLCVLLTHTNFVTLHFVCKN